MPDSYAFLIHKLVVTGMFSDTKSLLRQCNNIDGGDCSLLQEKLLDGGQALSSAAVVDLLIRVYVEDNQVSEATEVFNRVMSHGIKLNVLSCNDLHGLDNVMYWNYG